MFEIQIDTLVHVHFAFFSIYVQQSLMLINMAVPRLRHESSTVI